MMDTATTKLMPSIHPGFVALFLEHYDTPERPSAGLAYGRARHDANMSQRSKIVPDKLALIEAACVARITAPQHFTRRKVA